MKKSILIFASTTLILGSVITSCSTSSDKVEESKANVEEAQQDLEEAQQDYTEQYNKFKLESDEKITTNEKLIADLRGFSKDKKKEAKIGYEKTIDNLEEKNEKMKERMNDYKEDGNEKWQSFKDEFNHDMNELGESLKDLGKNNVK